MRRSKLFLLLTPALLLLALLLWPPPKSLLQPTDQQSTRILDRRGRLLYEVRAGGYGSSEPLTRVQIPPSFVASLLAIEDRTFYQHGGISLRGLLRAAYQDMVSGRIVSGGSTITEQLVRNRLHPAQRTFFYKIEEAFLALKLEQWTTKDQILTAYVNSAYFGHQAYGLSAAARTYFGKSPGELSLSETALLAGLPQSPSAMDPFAHFAAAKARQKKVLDALRQTNAIDQTRENQAWKEPIHLAQSRVAIRAPHFVMWLLDSRPDLATRGADIRTTLDLDLQTDIERIVAQKLSLLKDKNVTSAAVTVLDAHTGDVLAMVGSSDYFDTDHDGAVNVAVSPRQPGSALKPFTYALALEHGDTAATTVSDTYEQFLTQAGNPYTPRNYDYGEHGLVRYREALANSYNIAAVKVLQRVGVAALQNLLRESGISTLTDTPDHYGLALTLGDAEVPLLDLTKAYGVFARGGRTLGVRTLLSDPVENGSVVVDPRASWLITNILSDNTARLPEFGEDSPLAFDFPVAAKTGTTRNSRDNWTMGFTPDILVGVWVGNADNSPMRDTSGVTGAGPIFHDVMIDATKQLPPHAFTRPDGIVEKEICTLSGKLPTPLCPHTMTEVFLPGTEPKTPDDIYRSIALDSRSGLLASTTCDPQFVIHQTFTVFPKESAKWARDNGWTAPPLTVSPLCPSTQSTRDSSASESQPSSSTSSSLRARSASRRATPSSNGHYLEITQPENGDSFKMDPLIPDSQERITLEARADSSVLEATWSVDGQVLGIGKAPDFSYQWPLTPGRHTMGIIAGNLQDQRFMTVEK